MQITFAVTRRAKDADLTHFGGFKANVESRSEQSELAGTFRSTAMAPSVEVIYLEMQHEVAGPIFLINNSVEES